MNIIARLAGGTLAAKVSNSGERILIKNRFGIIVKKEIL
jgi:hypothetical protein